MNQQNVQQHTLHLGGSAIQVETQDFEHGYQQGYQRFQQAHASLELCDRDIYDFMLANIMHTAAAAENAGYITGWVAALLSRRVAREPQERNGTCRS